MNGFNTHRHNSNPKEKEFHDKFLAEFIEAEAEFKKNVVDKLIYGTNDHGELDNFLSDHEKCIVLSTIQWLGSAVGQSFLLSCGFEEVDNSRSFSFRNPIVQQQIQAQWNNYYCFYIDVPGMELTDDPFVFKYNTINNGYKLINLRKHESTLNDSTRRRIIIADIVSQLNNEVCMGSILSDEMNKWYQHIRNPSFYGYNLD
jgi:hypothetical protein